MGRYIRLEDVVARLKGKVSFDLDGADEEHKMQRQLAEELLVEAEAEVEVQLSQRYRVPFVSARTMKFKDLPDTTQVFIKTLCRINATMKLLDHDFGRGSAVDAENFYKTLQTRYEDMVDKRMLKKVEGMEDTHQYLYPPLPGLLSAFGKGPGDDGYSGAIIAVNPSNDGDYPSTQINDPSETWFGVTGDE